MHKNNNRKRKGRERGGTAGYLADNSLSQTCLVISFFPPLGYSITCSRSDGEGDSDTYLKCSLATKKIILSFKSRGLEPARVPGRVRVCEGGSGGWCQVFWGGLLSSGESGRKRHFQSCLLLVSAHSPPANFYGQTARTGKKRRKGKKKKPKKSH